MLQVRQDGTRGLGLGLFIVREIVRSHGGAVESSSSHAAGTTISLILPRRAAT
ncbi:MAG TPA: ATP-binding protein [Accumulibacter sp.]|nr:ATP-binding protein [Accumulibacter sp.]